MTDLSVFYEHTSRIDLDPHPQYRRESTAIAAADFATGTRPKFVVADNTARDALVAAEGDDVYVTGTDKVYLYNGAAWVLSRQLGAWDAWTPSFTQSNTGITQNTGTRHARYVREGRKITGSLRTTFVTGTLGVAGSSIFVTNASLPADPAFTTAEILGVGGGYFMLAGSQYAVQCVLLGAGSANATVLAFIRGDVVVGNYLGIDPSAAIANNDKCGVTFTYEAVS